MSRAAAGLEVRATSLRLKIALGDGQYLRETLIVNGKPMAPTAPNIRYAHRLIDEIRARVRAGTFRYSDYFGPGGNSGKMSAVSVAEQLDTWMASKRMEPSTKHGYKAAMNFWKHTCFKEDSEAVLGELALRAVKHSYVLTAIALQDDMSGKTINNYVSVGRQAFELAKLDALIDTNPFDGVKNAKWQKPPPDPFALDEIEAICADAAKHYPGHIHNMIEFWFFTGLRTSELLGLKWDSIDLAKRYMHIHEAIVRGLPKDSTKTDLARDVILNSRALASLQRQRPLTQLAGQQVFVDPKQRLTWSDEQVFRRTYWRPILTRLGIRYRRPYNMRHSWASMNLMAGRTPAWCARQLGHSVEVFLRTYARWIPGAQDHVEVDEFERWLVAHRQAQNS